MGMMEKSQFSCNLVQEMGRWGGSDRVRKCFFKCALVHIQRFWDRLPASNY